MLLLTEHLVGCPLRYFLTFPLKFGIRRDIFRANSPLGYEVEALARLEDTAICRWPYTSCLRDADGWNPERP